MKSNNFREQVALVTTWFKDWNECEQTVALYSLLKKSSPVQAKFLDQILQQSLAECTDVKQLEAKANDEAYVRSLYTEEKEQVIHQLLQLLPLLQVGKNSVKKAYLQLISELLSHTIHNGVNIEESRQLLSYSLIHPAITMEERRDFQTWLGCLEERFTYSIPHSGSSTNSSNSLSVGHSQSHSPSPGSSSQHSLTHMSPDLSVSQEVINVITANSAMVPNAAPTHGHSSPSNIIGSGAHPSWQQQNQGQGQYPGFDASAAINPSAPNGDTSGCAQYVSTSNGHLALRATNSHAGAFGASHGHAPLHATSSAPANCNSMNSMPPSGPPSHGQGSNQNTHAPLRRTHSITPPVRLQNSEKTVSDWLKTSHGHQHPSSNPILASRPQYSDHAPLSPQSSVTSSGSGDSTCHQDDGPQPTKDSFLEDGSGMREVPVWLKTLRLHKYAYLFRQMTYEEMLSVTEDWLEQQNVTKGARRKIYISIVKLRERQDILRKLEKNIAEEGGSIKAALGEMKAMLNTPIKAFNPAQGLLLSSINHPAYRTSSSSSSSSSTTTAQTSSPQSPSADEIVEGDLPAQFCHLMRKVCTQLLVASRPDDECFQIYLQLIDKCLNHEAFSSREKNLLQSWKQSAQKIWQPPPQKYGERPRRGFGNTYHFGGSSLGGRIMPRTGRVPVPVAYHLQQPGGIQQWSFGTKRSILGGGSGGGGNGGGSGHMQVHRNSSLNPAYLNKPGLLEQPKQPVSRTHSAPIHRPLSLALQGYENDTEINARLDSLCISMTEHALGSSDMNDRGSAY